MGQQLDLTLSPALIDALYDPDHFEGSILIPLQDQLGKALVHGVSDASLRLAMAQAVLAIMEGFASRRHIGVRSSIGFASAFAFMVYDSLGLPGHDDARGTTLECLRAGLLRSRDSQGHRPLWDGPGFFQAMAGALLMSARAAVSGGDDRPAPFADSGAILSTGGASLRQMMHLHASLSRFPGRLALSKKDVLKLRMVLDIAEPMLPEGLQPDRPDLAALALSIAADTAATLTTLRLGLHA